MFHISKIMSSMGSDVHHAYDGDYDKYGHVYDYLEPPALMEGDSDDDDDDGDDGGYDYAPAASMEGDGDDDDDDDDQDGKIAPAA